MEFNGFIKPVYDKEGVSYMCPGLYGRLYE